MAKRVFGWTIDGLIAGTASVETAVQTTGVARAIIDSAKVENEFVKPTNSNGRGFIPVVGEVVKNQKKVENGTRK